MLRLGIVCLMLGKQRLNLASKKQKKPRQKKAQNEIKDYGKPKEC